MAIPATQITPPTPETTNGEFRNTSRGQHVAEAVDTPETVVEQPEAEATEARRQQEDDAEEENGAADEPAEESETVSSTGPSMPGGASLTAQHAAAEAPHEPTPEMEATEQGGDVEPAGDEAGADGQEGKDFDEVTL